MYCNACLIAIVGAVAQQITCICLNCYKEVKWKHLNFYQAFHPTQFCDPISGYCPAILQPLWLLELSIELQPSFLHFLCTKMIPFFLVVFFIYQFFFHWSVQVWIEIGRKCDAEIFSFKWLILNCINIYRCIWYLFFSPKYKVRSCLRSAVLKGKKLNLLIYVIYQP